MDCGFGFAVGFGVFPAPWPSTAPPIAASQRQPGKLEPEPEPEPCASLGACLLPAAAGTGGALGAGAGAGASAGDGAGPDAGDGWKIGRGGVAGDET